MAETVAILLTNLFVFWNVVIDQTNFNCPIKIQHLNIELKYLMHVAI